MNALIIVNQLLSRLILILCNTYVAISNSQLASTLLLDLHILIQFIPYYDSTLLRPFLYAFFHQAHRLHNLHLFLQAIFLNGSCELLSKAAEN